MNAYKIEIKWAFVFIATTLLWTFLEKLLGLHSTHIDKHPYFSMLFMIPAVWVFVLALNDKKYRFYNGNMNFKQGLIAGLIVTLIVTLFTPLTQWIISNVISPYYFSNIIAHTVQNGDLQSLEAAQATFNYKNYAIQGTIMSAVMGLLTSLIVAFFVKTKP